MPAAYWPRRRKRGARGGKHTERNDITTQNLVTRCLVETFGSHAPCACLLGGRPPAFRNRTRIHLAVWELAAISDVSSAARPAEFKSSPTTSESERHELDSDATINLTSDRPGALSAPLQNSFLVVGKPLGNTLELFPPSGSPPNCQHAGKRVAGGVGIRRRNRTQRYATQYIHLMTLNGIETRST